MLPFVTGVLATLAALLLYRAFFPGPDLLTLREVEEAVVAMALALRWNPLP
jgi:hypothetical protein